MRAVIHTGPGKVELSFMWLPTFIGLDNNLKMALERELAPLFLNRPLTDEVLDEAHEKVLDFICERYKAIVGLRDYLDAMKFVEGPQ